VREVERRVGGSAPAPTSAAELREALAALRVEATAANGYTV
jgi:hypothetical protein